MSEKRMRTKAKAERSEGEPTPDTCENGLGKWRLVAVAARELWRIAVGWFARRG